MTVDALMLQLHKLPRDLQVVMDGGRWVFEELGAVSLRVAGSHGLAVVLEAETGYSGQEAEEEFR